MFLNNQTDWECPIVLRMKKKSGSFVLMSLLSFKGTVMGEFAPRSTNQIQESENQPMVFSKVVYLTDSVWFISVFLFS